MTEAEKKAIANIRAAKLWDSVTADFELLAHEAGVPDDWKSQDSGYNLETVIQRIDDYYQIELFRKAAGS